MLPSSTGLMVYLDAEERVRTWRPSPALIPIPGDSSGSLRSSPLASAPPNALVSGATRTTWCVGRAILMGRKKASRLLGLVGGLGALLLGAVVLGGATQAAAQAKPAAVPSGFAGAETCRSCHEDQFTKFEKTKMGRLFLRNARNTKESLGCESCHGSGKAHVDAGGSKGVGGMISFAKDDPTPVEKRNETCTSCHTKGERLFWKGSAHESRDVACTSCHKVMEDGSPRAALAK